MPNIPHKTNCNHDNINHVYNNIIDVINFQFVPNTAQLLLLGTSQISLLSNNYNDDQGDYDTDHPIVYYETVIPLQPNLIYWQNENGAPECIEVFPGKVTDCVQILNKT